MGGKNWRYGHEMRGDKGFRSSVNGLFAHMIQADAAAHFAFQPFVVR
jgi:hypothetical protein